MNQKSSFREGPQFVSGTLTGDNIPGWIIVRQTPDLGLMATGADRWRLDVEVIASRHFDDRFEALNRARKRLGSLAKERKKHAAGIAEWFRVSAEEARSALENT
jgi:hypothetical protein